MWNFFRLENEHLNNCGKFRAVRDISVAPINSSDQEKILRMMDEDEGVVNRRKRKLVPAKKPKEDKRHLLSIQTPDNTSLRTLSEWCTETVSALIGPDLGKNARVHFFYQHGGSLRLGIQSWFFTWPSIVKFWDTIFFTGVGIDGWLLYLRVCVKYLQNQFFFWKKVYTPVPPWIWILP